MTPDALRDFRIVLVTGPHRSGTTFLTAAMAYDLHRAYATETEIRERDGKFTVVAVDRLFDSVEDPFVFQGASCFRWLTRFQRDDLATVFVHRDYAAIRQSQRRMHGRLIDRPADKAQDWGQLKRSGKIKHPFDVHYEDFRGHALFAEDREGWGYRQFRSDGETAERTRGGLALV